MTPTTQTLATSTETLAGSPNQQYWDIGLKSFNNGDVATTAMKAIWKAMLPPASLNVLAAIVGSLYADTYWATTKLDRNQLAADLQASLGIDPGNCQRAAQFAFSKWYGMLVRGNFGDNGAIPKPGNLTASPDVVVNGRAPIDVSELITLWNQYTYDPVPGLKNYAYGRAQSTNIQEPIHSPVLRMFYSDAGFNPPPTSWIQMFTYTGGSATTPLQGLPTGPIPVGGKAANAEAFGFTPQGSGHFCLIGVVGTEFFTNNPLDTPGNWNSQEWLSNNGAAGWHNVDVPTGRAETLKFYNQDNAAEHFVFEAHCSKVTPGTGISLGFADKQLAQANPTRSLTISKGYEVVSIEGQIPPNYAGDLVVNIDGKPLPADASVDIRLYWRLPSSHAHFLQAVDQLGDTRALNQKTPVHVQLGSFTLVGK